MSSQFEKSPVRKAVCLFLLVILLAGMGTGCWDRIEIERLGFITAVGIDAVGSKDVLFTIQVVTPRMLAKGPGGGNGGESTPYQTYSVRARNVSDAVSMLQEQTSMYLRFKQLYVIVLGEGLARRSVIPNLDFFTRKSQLRRSIWVVVAKGKATDLLLNGDPGGDSFPAKFIVSILENRQDLTSTRYPVNLADFFSALTRPGIEGIMSSVDLRPEVIGAKNKQAGASLAGEAPAAKPQQVFTLSGAGVFNKQGRLVSFLGPRETRGVRWLQGKTHGGEITVPVAGQGTWASLLVLGEKTTVRPVVRQNEIRLQVEIKEQSYVSSIQREDLDISRPRYIQLLEQERENAIRREAMSAVTQAKKLHCDFIGFGEKIYETDPKLWNQIEGDWEDKWLPDLPVDIKVNCQIKRTGLTAEPVKPIF